MKSEPLPGSKRAKRQAAAEPERFRQLPASDSAERGLVSCFLLAPREIGALCAEKGIKAEIFSNPALATIYGVLLEMWDGNRPIDFILLTNVLHARNQLEQVGGAAYVTELFTYLPSAANVEWYIETLQEKFALRQIVATATEYANRGYEAQENVPGFLGEFEAAVLAIADNRSQVGAAPIKTAVMGAIEGLQELYERRGQVSGISTGFALLDKMLDGLHATEMVVIAARPSMGKTALAMNMAEHMAVHGRVPVAVFSLEMSTQQLTQRLLCSRAKVSLSRVRDGFLAERDFPALTAAASQLSESKLFIDDTSGLSILELRARARRLQQRHGIGAIFIDYLQLMRSGSKRAQENRQIEITEISSGLKGLAKELKLPIVVLAQLNRNPETRTGESRGRPRLADLRESGSIEQDADVVGLLVRDEYYAESDAAKEETAGKATLIIAKQRNGPVGDVPLTFLKEFTRFESRAEEEG